MKVKELIKKLQQFDENSSIYCLFSDDNPLENGVNINCVFELKGIDEKTDGVYIKEE